MFSATKDTKTNALAPLALKANPVEVDVDSDKKEATVDGLEQGKYRNSFCYHHHHHPSVLQSLASTLKKVTAINLHMYKNERKN